MLYEQPRVDAAKTAAARDTSDGSPPEMPVYVARPNGRTARRPGLVVLQEIFGVNGHIQDVTRRFAGQGFVAVAPDLFYRNEPWIALDYTQVNEGRRLAGTLTQTGLIGDLKAALAHLAAQLDVDPSRIGVVGYCLGGRLAVLAAGAFPDVIKAAAVYYGGGIAGESAAAVRCPVAGFFGALDKHISREAVERLDQALEHADAQHRIYYYPTADHGFFCDARASYHPQAAQDAWHRTLRLFAEHLGPVPEVSW